MLFRSSDEIRASHNGGITLVSLQSDDRIMQTIYGRGARGIKCKTVTCKYEC